MAVCCSSKLFVPWKRTHYGSVATYFFALCSLLFPVWPSQGRRGISGSLAKAGKTFLPCTLLLCLKVPVGAAVAAAAAGVSN